MRVCAYLYWRSEYVCLHRQIEVYIYYIGVSLCKVIYKSMRAYIWIHYMYVCAVI